MHLTRDVAASLAASFLEGLLIAHRVRAPGRQAIGSGFTYSYLGIDKLEVDPSLIGYRKTKLFAAGVADIRGTTPCRVADPDLEIIGMGVDWANTSGTLDIASGDTASLNINNAYSGADPKRFIFGIYPWLKPVAVQDGVISLSVEPNEKVAGPARIALGGLVARKPVDYATTCLLPRPMVISDALFSSNNASQFRDVKRWNRPVHYFDNLENFLATKSAPSGIYSIKALRTFFDVLLDDRKSSATVVVFHAAIANRADVKLPFFAGQKLAGADANVILVSDPALYTNAKVPLAWFAGRKGCPVQPILLLILKTIIERLGTKKLIFTGPSGGGFASLYYSYFFPDSLCVPSNPQTIIGNFNPAAVAAYCRACFGASGADAVERVLQTEIDSSLPDLYAGGVPNYVIYCQNSTDDHVELQEKPFRAALPPGDAPRAVFVHGNWGNGHVAPPATQWSQLLSAAVNWPGGWAGFLQSHDFSELGAASGAGRNESGGQ
ncbi:hypothetical protein AXW83_13525 [Bosea sp. PAMC 26642]|nr:hypothetical protein AXW83_13525 [Bosea sp. PAMC 26642]